MVGAVTWMPSPSRAKLLLPSTRAASREDRKSTRLNSSHLGISYAVFCLKKKKRNKLNQSQELEPKRQNCRTTNGNERLAPAVGIRQGKRSELHDLRSART